MKKILAALLAAKENTGLAIRGGVGGEGGGRQGRGANHSFQLYYTLRVQLPPQLQSPRNQAKTPAKYHRKILLHAGTVRTPVRQ